MKHLDATWKATSSRPPIVAIRAWPTLIASTLGFRPFGNEWDIHQLGGHATILRYLNPAFLNSPIRKKTLGSQNETVNQIYSKNQCSIA